jgi:hypothetical protein
MDWLYWPGAGPVARGFEVSLDGGAIPACAWRSRRVAGVVKILVLEPSRWLHPPQIHMTATAGLTDPRPPATRGAATAPDLDQGLVR